MVVVVTLAVVTYADMVKTLPELHEALKVTDLLQVLCQKVILKVRSLLKIRCGFGNDFRCGTLRIVLWKNGDKVLCLYGRLPEYGGTYVGEIIWLVFREDFFLVVFVGHVTIVYIFVVYLTLSCCIRHDVISF